MANQGQPISNQYDLNAKLLELQSILENIDRGFMSVDRNWCISYVNAKAASDTGKKVSELIGRNLWAEFPQLKGTAAAEMYRKTMEKGVASEIEEHSVLTGCWNVHKSFPSINGIVIAWADITEGKKTEEALKQSKNKLQDILNGIDDGITLVGLDGKVLDCNKASLRLLGLTYDEFIGTSVYDIIIDEDKQRALNGASEVLKTGKVVNEVRVRRKNKRYFWAEISVTALYNKNGQPNLFLGITRDITERKKLETSLKFSEEKFSKAFLNSPFGVTLTCLSNGKTVEVNESAASLFGYNRNEIIGKTTLELQLWPNNKEREDFIQKLVSKGTVDNQELSLHRRDGAEFLILISSSLIELQGEKHFLSTFLDITDRKKAEEALKESEERFRALVETTSDWIWQVDKNTVYTYASPKIKDILGYNPQEIVGKTPFDFIPKDEAKKLRNHVQEINNSNKPFYGLENWKIHKNGSLVLFETNGVPILDEKGRLTGYRGIDRDITERKKLQQELENHSKYLEKLVEERTKQLQEQHRLVTIGQTAGMVGHDIRNPLQAIVSELYLAKQNMEEAPDSKGKQDTIDSINFIQEQVDYINKIVADLQDYARNTKPTVREVNVKALINSSFSALTIPSNIDAKYRVEGDPQINTDPDYLRRIITNLSTNAIQAMPDGGKLTLKVEHNNRYVEISISDTGNGIPKDIQDKIFSPLFTTKSKGQGFGLPVVKKFVEQLGGTITFDSKEGEGTKFTIKLPASAQVQESNVSKMNEASDT